MNFCNKCEPIYIIKDFIKENFDKIISREQTNSPNNGSGWSFSRCNKLILKLNKYTPLKGNCFIGLSNVIKNKKACINLKNKDDCCFIYNIRYAVDKFYILEYKDSERVERYQKYINDEIFSGFEYPMKLEDLSKFERKKFKGYPSMSINVYSLDINNTILPLKISELENAELEIDLLFLTEDINSHYIFIKDLSKLVSK